MAKLFNPFFQAIDGNGNPLAGAKLNFYITGTTTRKNTYSNPDLAPGNVNTNPVVADSNGRFGSIYLAQDVDYKAILTNSADVTVSNGTVDPLLYISSDSIIAHQGSLIIGSATGAEEELLINANTDAALRSDGTKPEWRRSNYTKQVFTSGSGTYTTPANCTAIWVRVQAAGGGGGGVGGTTGPNGAAGSDSSFNSVVATAGSGGLGNATGTPLVGGGGTGGTGGAGTASFRIRGSRGGNSSDVATSRAGGGGTCMGQGAPESVGATAAGTAGLDATPNSGGGAGPASSQGTTSPGSAGGGGEFFELHISHPAASYPYVVGGGGAGGIGTGTGAATGGAGGSGIVIVEEFYS